MYQMVYSASDFIKMHWNNIIVTKYDQYCLKQSDNHVVGGTAKAEVKGDNREARVFGGRSGPERQSRSARRADRVSRSRRTVRAASACSALAVLCIAMNASAGKCMQWVAAPATRSRRRSRWVIRRAAAAAAAAARCRSGCAVEQKMRFYSWWNWFAACLDEILQEIKHAITLPPKNV